MTNLSKIVIATLRNPDFDAFGESIWSNLVAFILVDYSISIDAAVLIKIEISIKTDAFASIAIE